MPWDAVRYVACGMVRRTCCPISALLPFMEACTNTLILTGPHATLTVQMTSLPLLQRLPHRQRRRTLWTQQRSSGRVHMYVDSWR